MLNKKIIAKSILKFMLQHVLQDRVGFYFLKSNKSSSTAKESILPEASFYWQFVLPHPYLWSCLIPQARIYLIKLLKLHTSLADTFDFGQR